MRFPPVSDESHVVRQGSSPRVHLSAFGWFVAITLGSSIGLLVAALVILSMKGWTPR
jgi:hypothetical protein